MKQLFAVFKRRTKYCHRKDFNEPVKFHAVLIRLSKEERVKNATLTTDIQTAKNNDICNILVGRQIKGF
jgi:hypothetical protein